MTDKPDTDPLFRPLSAKTSRKKFSAGGREMDEGRARMGQARQLGEILRRANLRKAAKGKPSS